MRSRFFALVLLGAASGCATLGGATGASKTPNVAGIWEGAAQGTIPEGPGAGDTRIERQAWHLQQHGDKVTGYYVLDLTMISGDGRPYVCSREPRFDTVLRFAIEGRVGPRGIELAEVGEVESEGPCRPAFRTPGRFQAEMTGDQLVLADGSYRLTLYRKDPRNPPAADDATDVPDPTVPVDRPPPPQTVTASLTTPPGTHETPAEVSGVWVWEHRGRLPTGDEKQEREEWHLEQSGNQVSGFYDRSIHQVSTDGLAYRCSNATDFRITTRYHLHGEVRGSELVLREQSYEILQASPCDSGRRNLDAYKGEASIDELRLKWGVGSQVLRRDRPEIPSQRF